MSPRLLRAVTTSGHAAPGAFELDDAVGRRRPVGVVAGQPIGVGFVARRLLGHVIGGRPPARIRLLQEDRWQGYVFH